MSTDCLFCKIAKGQIPSDKIYEDEQVYAFNDINPQAPFHALIVPRKHISTINDLELVDQSLIGHMMLSAKKIAAENNLSESGYRTIMNCNQDGGQTVFHIHLHILGGKQMVGFG